MTVRKAVSQAVTLSLPHRANHHAGAREPGGSPWLGLRGKVHSWAERMAVQGASWSAPGITHVVNELIVSS